MFFQPDVVSNCPEGLELFPALVDVPSGSTKVVKIPVLNLTKHGIYLTKRTVIGTLEEVTEVRTVSLSPVNEPLSHSSVNTCSAQLNTDEQRQTHDKHPKPDMTKQRWHPPVYVSHLEDNEQ